MERLNFVEKYLDDETIILDRIGTYPKDVLIILNNHKELMNEYIKEKDRILELQKSLNQFGNSIGSNKYYAEMQMLLAQIIDLLYQKNYFVLVFHATNLLDRELGNIRKKGLRIFNNRSFIKFKLHYLKYYGISDSEIQKLYSQSRINESHYENSSIRQNKIYFFSSIDKVPAGEHVSFLSQWCGELLDKKESQSFLKSKHIYGKPYIIVAKLKTRNILKHSSLNDLLERLITNWYMGKDECIDSRCLTLKNQKVLDIVGVENDYKTIKCS